MASADHEVQDAGIGRHSPEVSEEALSDAAHSAMIQRAEVPAMSCLDLFLNPGVG